MNRRHTRLARSMRRNTRSTRDRLARQRINFCILWDESELVRDVRANSRPSLLRGSLLDLSRRRVRWNGFCFALLANCTNWHWFREDIFKSRWTRMVCSRRWCKMWSIRSSFRWWTKRVAWASAFTTNGNAILGYDHRTGGGRSRREDR